MSLEIASVFSGVGGIERGLHQAGHETVFQCEIQPTAREVLRRHFDVAQFRTDLTALSNLPTADLVTAGFPCQDLSQAGTTKGIRGHNSSLVNHLFDLLEKKRKFPQWVLLENVPFMLKLQNGRAMRHVTKRLERMGLKWAYRVVDSRAFGLPQRRRRVILLASRDHDPCNVLFADDAKPEVEPKLAADAYGFYWTEGNTGLGWTVDGVPTLKGGSGLGIPCPPAIWFAETDRIVTPDIRDAERLQGFPPNWTRPAMNVTNRVGERWKLVGNAVSVPIAKWVGKRLTNPGDYDSTQDTRLLAASKLPRAAWGHDGIAFESKVSEWPKNYKYLPLASFLKYEPKSLSLKATSGFYNRLRKSSLRRPLEFDAALESHIFHWQAKELEVA